MLQAPMFDGLSLDPFALFDDGGCLAEVGIGGCHVVEALVVAAVIVMFDERLDLLLEIAGQEVVFEKDAVFQGLVPTFDLALGLRMERGAAHMGHLLGLDIFRQLARDVLGPLSLSSLGLCNTVALSQPEAARARSSESVTSLAHMVEHRRQAMM